VDLEFRMRSRLVLVVPIALVSCNGGNADLCVSGTFWEGGEDGSPLMNPGEDCIACHSQGEGPAYDVAGTVYTNLDEPMDCNGVDTVTVEITDADAVVFDLTTNAAGNFTHAAGGSTIVFPITAKVLSGAAEHAMVTPQESGSCNECHTDVGEDGAPAGRVTVP
jgi:hypothetical protein